MTIRGAILWVLYLFIVSREIWRSAVTVAWLALGPIERLRSGFLAVPMEARSDIEITTLANSITLTPGSITVHVEPNRHTIVIHSIDIGQNPDQVRQSVQTVLEANILRWSRANQRKGPS